MGAPAASRARATATPRPSAIPPAASTGVGAAKSTTTGTNGNVDRPRPAPCPPPSVPLRHDDIGAHGLPVPSATIGSSRASQSRSPLPPPSRPRPPPLATAAAIITLPTNAGCQPGRIVNSRSHRYAYLAILAGRQDAHPSRPAWARPTAGLLMSASPRRSAATSRASLLSQSFRSPHAAWFSRSASRHSPRVASASRSATRVTSK